MLHRVFFQAAILLSVSLLLLASPDSVLPPRSTLYQLAEEQPSGTFVADLRQDLNPAPGASFVLVSSTPDLNLFTIHAQTGVIRTATVIDREVICPRAPACLVELDIGLQPAKFFQLVKVKIDILDVNDNPPRFNQPRVVKSLAEGTGPGFVLPLPPADDQDSPVNGVARYEIVTKSAAFELKVGRGEDGVVEPRLELVEGLDRERQAFHQIKVRYEFDRCL